jgi:hypothetical protein
VRQPAGVEGAVLRQGAVVAGAGVEEGASAVVAIPTTAPHTMTPSSSRGTVAPFGFCQVLRRPEAMTVMPLVRCVVSCRVVSCRVVACHVMSYRVLPPFAQAMLRDAQKVVLPTTQEPVKMRVRAREGCGCGGRVRVDPGDVAAEILGLLPRRQARRC